MTVAGITRPLSFAHTAKEELTASIEMPATALPNCVTAILAQSDEATVEFRILPFHDEAGRIVGIAAILRDVTKRFEEMKALRNEFGMMSAGRATTGARPGRQMASAPSK